MKKKLAFAAAAAFLMSGAAAADDSTGCGVGSMIFDGQSGVFPQILAVTTNGSTGNQTFGITSGTLGCDSEGTIDSAAKMSMFTGDNMESLALDMSRGEGESLQTLAELMGVAEADRAAFYAATKSNFDRIYTSSDVTAGDVIVNLQAVMAEDEQLKAYAG